MEEPVLEHLSERALDEPIHQLGRVGTVGLELALVHQAGAIHPLQGQDLARGELGVDARHEDVRESPVELHEALGVGGLGRVVDFPVNKLPEVVDHRDDVDVALQHAQNPVDQASIPAKDVQIHGDNFLAARPLNLHRNRLASRAQCCLVDLADGGCRDRVFLQQLEDLVERDAQLRLHHLEGLLVRKGRQAVLQLLELLQVLGGKEVWARRQGLSCLDDRRT